MTGTEPAMETVSPTGKNLVDTHDNYRKCEEKNESSSWTTRNNVPIDSWVFRDVHNYSIAILLPVFLALCFLMTMLGVVFLFTSCFLVTKYYVLEVFINECNSSLIMLIFFTIGIHLLTTGLAGVIGLGTRRWFLVVHAVLAMCALLTMTTSYYYEPRYETIIMDEADSVMWNSLSATRFKFHSGWDYIHRYLQCCGVNGYTDWCGCSNVTAEFKKIVHHSLPKEYKAQVEKRNESWSTELVPPLPFSNAGNDLSSAKLEASSTPPVGIKLQSQDASSEKYNIPSDYDIEYNIINSSSDSKSSDSKREENRILLHAHEQKALLEEKSFLKNKTIKENNATSGNSDVKSTQNEEIVIECYIPDSCCTLTNGFPYNELNQKCLNAYDETGLNTKGCRTAIKHTMKRFINSYMSMCKFIILIMVIDFPLVLLMISSH